MARYTIAFAGLVKQSEAWTSALIGFVGVAALVMSPGAALAGPGTPPCSTIANIATCTGDQSDGITNQGVTPDFTTPLVDTLIVNNLTQAIAPASGVDGIQFLSAGGNITINSDTGSFGINAPGVSAIFADSKVDCACPPTNTGAVIVTSIGDLQGRIFAESKASNGSTGAVMVTSTGNIQGDIFAVSQTLSGGPSGDVTVTSTGNISLGILAESDMNNGFKAGDVTVTSTGNNGTGIFAQSIVEFVGNAGAVTVTNIGDSGSIKAFSFSTNNGDAGAVTVTSTGNILGGGFISAVSEAVGNTGPVTVTNAGFVGSIGAVSQVLALGNAGAVTVTSAGSFHGDISAISLTNDGDASAVTVTSTGAGSITAESRSDLGTVPGTGNAGPVTVTSTGNERFIVAESSGTTSNGNIMVSVLGGTLGGSSIPTVEFQGGAINTLNNSGTILPDTSAGHIALAADVGNDTINNFGTIIGNVDLGSGTNAFNNNVGSLFAPGATVDLGGSPNTLTNEGILSPGGVGQVQITTLNGDLIQTGAGTYSVDVNGSAADLVHVSGATATADLAGTVGVNLISLPGGLHPQWTILQTDAVNHIINSGITAPLNSAAVSYSLLFVNNPSDNPLGEDLVLSATINFAPGGGGLNDNQTAIGQNLTAIVAAGGSPAMSSLLTALAHLSTQQGLANALDQLSPEIYNYDIIETLYASQQFSNDLMSCRVAGEDGAAFIREGQCIWARLRGRQLDLAHTSDNLGAKDTTWSFSSGIQFALGPDWRLGFAAGYDHINLDTSNSTDASSVGDRGNVGGVIKYNPGPLLLAAGVTGGLGSYVTTRSISFPGFSAVNADVAASHNEIDYVSGQLHAAYLFSEGNWYLKPLVDAAVTQLDLTGFSESRGNGAALTLPGRTDTVFSVSPGLEIGSQLGDDKVGVWRPFIRGGVTWQDTDHFLLDAGFLEAPQGISPFFISTKLDQVLADVAAGVDFIHVSGAVLRVQYDGRFAQDTQLNSVSLKGSAQF